MSKKQQRLYGTWPSPVSIDMVSGELRLNTIAWDTASNTLVWSEGKGTLMTQSGVDAPIDLTGDKLHARGRVGYGGGEMAVAQGQVYFTGNRLHKVPISGDHVRKLTPAFGGSAAPAVSVDGKWVVYVHTYERKDSLAVVATDGQQWPRKLYDESDFVMQPVWHPSGNRLAFVTWNHPRMPWDGTELRVANVAYDAVGFPYLDSVEVLTGDKETAIFQPEFSPDGRYLSYISDATGYGQLYLYDLDSCETRQLTYEQAEHGVPAWVQGKRTYAWSAQGKDIYFLRNRHGVVSLHRYALEDGTEHDIESLNDYTFLEQISIAPNGSIGLIASAPRVAPQVISFDPTTGAVRIHRRSVSTSMSPSDLAEAEAIAWTGADGETIYGVYYPPTSTRYEADGAPPLTVYIHGGPTSQVYTRYDATTQFFATRGYAVLHVNHRGSTGYGRDYMLKLRGNWGVYDVEDAASGAEYLASQGKADPDMFVIMGGSAGGFTVLQSLIHKPGFYAAGICRYGVSNQFSLVQDTHKFEERYSDSLLGPLPEAAAIYRERSPEFFAERIQDPIAIFQGTKDTVVPKRQSDSIVAVVKTRGVPHEYHVYEGEGHGFREPETLKHYYESVLSFLERYVIYA